jgi:hypothetical protein
MRTTVNIDEDVLIITRQIAVERHMSLGEAVTFLLRRGMRASSSTTSRNGFSLFDIGDNKAKFGPVDVARAMEAEDLDSALPS